MGIAKRHCSICPRTQKKASTVCPHLLYFNKSSGCQGHTCHIPHNYPHNCRRAATVDPAVTHSSVAPAPNSMPQALNQQPRVITAKNKVEQSQRKQRPSVSTPLDGDKVISAWISYRSFVDNSPQVWASATLVFKNSGCPITWSQLANTPRLSPQI